MHAPSTHRPGGTSRWLKVLGLLCCAVPLGIVLMFAAGEGLAGWGHLVQAAPLLLLMLLAWWRPFAGGALIVAAAIAMAVLYVMNVGEPSADLMALLFGPAIVGGIVLLGAGRVEARGT